MEKRYRAKISLNTAVGVIKPGKPVPKDYPGIERAIKMGWVEEILVDERTGKIYAEVLSGKEIKPTEELVETLESETESDSPPDTESSSTQSDSILTEITMETKIADIPFLQENQIKGLNEADIDVIADLMGIDASELCRIDRIGKETANKLINIFKHAVGG